MNLAIPTILLGAFIGYKAGNKDIGSAILGGFATFIFLVTIEQYAWNKAMSKSKEEETIMPEYEVLKDE